MLPAAESLVTELARHAGTLGLDQAAPRLVTARAAAKLLNQLAALTDATALLRALAQADLPHDGVIYRASLDSARNLAYQIAALKWDVIDRTLALTGGGGPDAERASVIAQELRAAARRDEHESGLSDALRAADTAATGLLLDITQTAQREVNDSGEAPGIEASPAGAGAEHGPDPGQPRGLSAASAGQPGPAPVAWVPPGDSTARRQVNTGDVDEVADELRRFAGAHPDVTMEVTWRIVTP